uniref:Decapping nuclease n=1 Tax=Tetranychus urticae TaxID=32264 RepID=T1KUF4_TETUR
MSLIETNFVQKELDLKCAKTNHDLCLERPKKLGYFSIYRNDDKESVYCPDKSALAYLDLPDPVSINCLQGYDPNNKYGYQRDLNYDFVCNNGVLKDIMTSPYQNLDWTLCAVKIRGKIVLNKIASNEEKESIEARSENDNKSIYAAFNLQRLVVKNNNRSEFTSGKETDSFHGVFHSNIGFHGVLHAGYLNDVESKQELDKSFDEMKFVLVKKFNAPKESHSFFHANTWWSLAILSGIDTIFRAKCEQDLWLKILENYAQLNDCICNVYYDFDTNLSVVEIRGKVILNKQESIEMKEKIDTRPERENKPTYAALNLQRFITKYNNRFECTSGRKEESFYGVFPQKLGLIKY